MVAAEGQVVILRDSGARQLPSFAPRANVSTDGRRYTVMYQHRLPSVTVSWPTAPSAPSYVLEMGSRLSDRRPSLTVRYDTARPSDDDQPCAGIERSEVIGIRRGDAVPMPPSA